MVPGRTSRRRVARAESAELVVFGTNAVHELLRRGEQVERLYLAHGSREDELSRLAAGRGVAVERVDRGVLDRLARSSFHQGAVAIAPPFRYRPLEELLEPERTSVLVLDGVQAPRNLGAILRTAAAVGVGGVVLPRERSVGITSVVAATSAGLLFGLPITQVPNLVRAMEALKEAGFWLVGLVPQGGESLFRATPPGRPGVVIGGEGDGLRPLVARHCDFTVSVPMAPGVESLNVSVAAGVALYELLVRRGGA